MIIVRWERDHRLNSQKKRSPLNYKKTRSLCTEKGNRQPSGASHLCNK
ncbi:MAG: hypothetical protein KA717_26390 [Woronichinia naegeliana WA131]|uniref:Uncharacterized protein n=1 Tax=Woronichinia naegeliana WA131 TaxID=2824559 RepID=A0A977KT34_9CYAN|nr:MAG: hypothetical protein KA717_26390 [Woronichinia naegeliana WA131]